MFLPCNRCFDWSGCVQWINFFFKFIRAIFTFQGHNGLAARALFELMTDGPPIVAVLGPTLSPELTVVGQITPVYDVLHVSGELWVGSGSTK